MIEALSIIVLLGTIYLAGITIADAVDTAKIKKSERNRQARLKVKAEARELLEESRRKK